MLSELSDMQESDEDVWSITISIETETQESGQIIHSEYDFSYAKEWDKWMFTEYKEKRAPVNDRRAWHDARHISWHDIHETPSINVPQSVADRLAEATSSENVTIQIPRGSLQEPEYEEIYVAQ